MTSRSASLPTPVPSFRDRPVATIQPMMLSDTVVAENGITGVAPLAGVATIAARGDHTHGTPSFGTTVVAEQTYGLAPAVGDALTVARSNHTHGTPALGTAVVGEQSFGLATAVGVATTAAKADHTHGTPMARHPQSGFPAVDILSPGVVALHLASRVAPAGPGLVGVEAITGGERTYITSPIPASGAGRATVSLIGKDNGNAVVHLYNDLANGLYGSGGTTSSPFSVELEGDLTFFTIANTPPLAPAGQARIYYNSAAGKAQISENGAAYRNIGGSDLVLGTTVVSETAFSQSATAGSASTASRTDHTHGTPLPRHPQSGFPYLDFSGAGVVMGRFTSEFNPAQIGTEDLTTAERLYLVPPMRTSSSGRPTVSLVGKTDGTAILALYNDLDINNALGNTPDAAKPFGVELTGDFTFFGIANTPPLAPAGQVKLYNLSGKLKLSENGGAYRDIGVDVGVGTNGTFLISDSGAANGRRWTTTSEVDFTSGTLDVTGNISTSNSGTISADIGLRGLRLRPTYGGSGIYGSGIEFNSSVISGVSPNTFTVLSNTGQMGGAALIVDYTGNISLYSYNAGSETGGTRTVNLSTVHRLQITDTGNVGIGTSNPSYKLVVSDGGASGFEFIPFFSAGVSILQTYNRATSVYNTLRMDSTDFRFNVSGAERVRIDVNGNIGIGTTNPQQKLHVVSGDSSGATPGRIAIADTLGSRTLTISSAASGIHSSITQTGTGGDIILNNVGSTGLGGLALQTDSQHRVYIDNTGKIGVGGITNPSYALHINGTTGIRAVSGEFSAGLIGAENSGAAYSRLFVTSPSHVNGWGRAVLDLRGLSDGSATVRFYNDLDVNGAYGDPGTGAASRPFKFSFEGSLGIGTEDPGVALDVVGVIRGRSGLTAGHQGVTGYLQLAPGSAVEVGYLGWYKVDGTRLGYMGFSATDVLLQLENSSDFVVMAGNVGLGTTNPDTRLVVAGNTRITGSTAPSLLFGDGSTAVTDLYILAESSLANVGVNIKSKGSSGVNLNYNNASTGPFLWWGGGTGPMFSVSSAGQGFFAGNVGIGSTNPQSALDLGLGSSGRSLVWGGSSGANHYASIGTAYSSASLNLLSGLKLDTTTDGIQHSYTGTYGVSGMRFDFTLGQIVFFTGGPAARTISSVFDYGVNTRMIIKSSGNVGIGIDPITKLHVNGDMTVGTVNASLLSVKTTRPSVRAALFGVEDLNTEERVYITSPSGVATWGWAVLEMSGANDGTARARFFNDLDVNNAVGNTGASARPFRLELLGTMEYQTIADTPPVAPSGTARIYYASGKLKLSENGGAYRNIGSDLAPGAAGTFLVTDTAGTGTRWTANNELFISSAGNVGIGTTNPVYKLVVSNGGASGFEFIPGYSSGVSLMHTYNRSTSTYDVYRLDAAAFHYTIQGTEKVRIHTNGYLGIGNTAPGNQLTVGSQSGSSNANIAARSGNSNSFEWGHTNTAGFGHALGWENNSGFGFLAFMSEAGTTANTYRTRGNIGRVLVGRTDGTISFNRVTNANADNQALTQDMVLDSSGNLGIGIGPTAKLDVNGVINARDLISFPRSGHAGPSFIAITDSFDRHQTSRLLAMMQIASPFKVSGGGRAAFELQGYDDGAAALTLYNDKAINATSGDYYGNAGSGGESPFKLKLIGSLQMFPIVDNPPAVLAGAAMLFYNGTTNKLQVSENGGAFRNIGSDLAPGAAGSFLVTNTAGTAAVWAATTEIYFDDTNNRIGIGTTVPQERLSVRDGTAGLLSTFFGPVGANFIAIGNDKTTGNSLVMGYDDTAETANFNVWGAVSGGLSILSNGRIGIGTTTSDAMLSFGAHNGSTASVPTISLHSNGSNKYGFGVHAGPNGQLQSFTTGYFAWHYGGFQAIGTNEIMQLKDWGNLYLKGDFYVGTSNDSLTGKPYEWIGTIYTGRRGFGVSHITETSARVHRPAGVVATYQNTWVLGPAWHDGAGQAVIEMIGYGVNDPGSPRGARVNVYNDQDTSNNYGVVGATKRAMAFQVYGSVEATSYITTSAREMKREIRDDDTDSLDIVRRLRKREFQWLYDGDGEERRTGFVADEVAAAYNPIAAYDHTGKVVGWKHDEMTVHLVGSVQTLAERSDALDSEIEKLKKENTALKARVSVLEGAAA